VAQRAGFFAIWLSRAIAAMCSNAKGLGRLGGNAQKRQSKLGQRFFGEHHNGHLILNLIPGVRDCI